MSDQIYRVRVRTTGSLQPGRSGTFWNQEVIYCGSDLTDARIAFLKSEPEDFHGGYGSRCRETIIESLKSEPEEIDDTETAEVEIE